MKKTILALSLILSTSAYSLEIENKEDYLVKKGDTLWDISDHFLKNPWEWEKLWKNNPHIINPHLIYPEDLIVLSFNEKGEPVISVEKKAVKKTLNLNKDKKVIIQKKINDNIPSVNTKEIGNFDKKYSIEDKNLEKNIIESNLINKKGDEIVVYIENANIGDIYSTIKNIKSLSKEKDLYRKTGKIQLKEKNGDFWIANVIDNYESISKNDIVKKTNDFDSTISFFPTKPKVESANVIDTLDKISASKNDVILINKGSDQSIELGNLFHIVKEGKKYKINGKELSTGNQKKATILVYKVEKDFSMAIIVENKELIKNNDKIVSPF